MVGQLTNPTFPASGITLCTYIGEASFFDAGQVGLPGETPLTEGPGSVITMEAGTAVYLRWHNNRWVIVNATRNGAPNQLNATNGPAVYFGF